MTKVDDFPWREYTEKELDTEYVRLVSKINDTELRPMSRITPIIPFSTIGFKCTNSFFQYERMNTPGIGRPSTIEYWNKNHKNVRKFSKKVNRDLFSTLNYFNHAPSQFPIVTAGKIYKYFRATKVFDPYAGWGDRCLGAIALNISYIGVDSNKKLKDPYKKLLKWKKNSSESSTSIIIDKCENVDIKKLEFDFVLTSPPFWTKGKMIERYGSIELEREDFMKNSLIPVVGKCISSGVWVCLYIPEDMYIELEEIIGPCRKILKFKVTNCKIGNLYCWKNKI
jgi:hypothetical protein